MYKIFLSLCLQTVQKLLYYCDSETFHHIHLGTWYYANYVILSHCHSKRFLFHFLNAVVNRYMDDRY